MLPDERQLVGMEAPAEAATAAPAVPRSEAEQVDAGQICSQYHNVTDAMNAAWPGGEARARFRRAVAGLLLRSQRKCQRPHTMTNVSVPRCLFDKSMRHEDFFSCPSFPVSSRTT